MDMAEVKIKMDISLKHLVLGILIILFVQWICVILPTTLKSECVTNKIGNRKFVVPFKTEEHANPNISHINGENIGVKFVNTGSRSGFEITDIHYTSEITDISDRKVNLDLKVNSKNGSRNIIDHSKDQITNSTNSSRTIVDNNMKSNIRTKSVRMIAIDHIIDLNITRKPRTKTFYDKGNVNGVMKNIDDNNSIMALVDKYAEKEGMVENLKTKLRQDSKHVYCPSCRKFDFKTSYDSLVCQSMANNLQIFLLILSKPENLERRMSLRKTYLSDIQGKSIKYVFIMGKSETAKIEQQIVHEISNFSDILKFDFIDSYENLTIKSISAFKWTSKNCKQAKYVMKLDDDVWVNINMLFSATMVTSFIKYIGGYCYNGAAPVREAKHKHFVSKMEYPHETFPPYCNGPSYIMTQQTVHDIGIISSYVPYVHIEDVFIGICLKRLHYNVTHDRRFHRFEGYRHPCYYKSADVLTFHQLPSAVFEIIWKANCTPGKNYDAPKEVQSIWSNLTDFPNRKTCNKCFNFRFGVLLENNVCANNEFKIDVFLLIFTKPENIQNRLYIRQTYLSPFNKFNLPLRYLFVMGTTNDRILNEMVGNENNIFRDILKFDFADTYLNLTIKTLNGLNWVTSNCKKAEYILKIDDDVWLNSRILLSKLKTDLYFENIAGSCYSNGGPIRDIYSKYYISPQIYPHYNYPPFCVGPSYILRQHVAKDVVKMAANVPFFQLEDVYVGLCLYYLRYNFTFIPSILPYTSYQFPCWFKSEQVLTFHSVSPNFMKEIWTHDCSNFSQNAAKEAIIGTPHKLFLDHRLKKNHLFKKTRQIAGGNTKKISQDNNQKHKDFMSELRQKQVENVDKFKTHLNKISSDINNDNGKRDKKKFIAQK